MVVQQDRPRWFRTSASLLFLGAEHHADTSGFKEESSLGEMVSRSGGCRMGTPTRSASRSLLGARAAPGGETESSPRGARKRRGRQDSDSESEFECRGGYRARKCRGSGHRGRRVSRAYTMTGRALQPRRSFGFSLGSCARDAPGEDPPPESHLYRVQPLEGLVKVRLAHVGDFASCGRSDGEATAASQAHVEKPRQ